MIGINHDEGIFTKIKIIILGNFWNIYNLPKFFDVSEQPLLTIADFNECVSTAFASLPETIRNAASYVYLSNKCDYTNGKHKFLAEQVFFIYSFISYILLFKINQMVGDYFFTCDSIWLADQMDDAAGKVFIYYFDQFSR